LRGTHENNPPNRLRILSDPCLFWTPAPLSYRMGRGDLPGHPFLHPPPRTETATNITPKHRLVLSREDTPAMRGDRRRKSQDPGPRRGRFPPANRPAPEKCAPHSNRGF